MQGAERPDEGSRQQRGCAAVTEAFPSEFPSHAIPLESLNLSVAVPQPFTDTCHGCMGACGSYHHAADSNSGHTARSKDAGPCQTEQSTEKTPCSCDRIDGDTTDTRMLAADTTAKVVFA